MLLRLLCTAWLFAALVGTAEGQVRKWTDKSASYSIQGEFVALAGDQVVLRREDGKNILVPLEKLSAADQEYVRQKATSKPEEPFAVQEPVMPAPKPSGGTADNEGAAQDSGTLREIVATGRGASEEEAKRDAFHNAVEQAVGVYVDATTIVDNDKLIEDRVLTYSNAYIKSFTEIRSSASDGVHTIKIKAMVKVQQLAEKLRSEGIKTTAPASGSDLAAEATTKAERQQDATALLKQAFENFPIKCLTATPGKLRVDAANASGHTNVTVPVTVTVDRDRYRSFDTSVRNILKAMAAPSKSYTFDLSDAYKQPNVEFHAWFQPGGMPLYGFFGRQAGLSELHFGSDEQQRLGIFGVALYDLEKSNLQRTRWSVFEVAQEHYEFFRKMAEALDDTEMTITLRDVDGGFVEEITCPTRVEHGKVVPRKGTINALPVVVEGIKGPSFGTSLSLQNRYIARDQYHSQYKVPVFPIAPLFFFFHTNFSTRDWGLLSPEIRFAATFQDLELEAVKRIDHVECALIRPSR